MNRCCLRFLAGNKNAGFRREKKRRNSQNFSAKMPEKISHFFALIGNTNHCFILLFSHLIFVGFEKCWNVRKNFASLCPQKKITLTELHFSVYRLQIPLQLKMYIYILNCSWILKVSVLNFNKKQKTLIKSNRCCWKDCVQRLSVAFKLWFWLILYQGLIKKFWHHLVHAIHWIVFQKRK